MADDDDLDAFFDEVDEVEQNAKDEKEDNESDKVEEHKQDYEERPTKKVKTGASLTKAPRGVVVVSKEALIKPAEPTKITHIGLSSSLSTSASAFNNSQIHGSMYTSNPPLPPPPLPPNQAKPAVRTAAGKKWEDASLAEFPANDFRLFIGNLAKDITEVTLAEAFSSKYPSFAMARIVYNKHDGASKGYGFVSVMDPKDCASAIREMDQSWLGSRPIKVKRSDWKDRDLKEVRSSKKWKRKGRR
jgi:hypothetical protein